VMTRLAELLPVAYRGAYASLTAPSSGEAQIALAAGQSSTDGMHRSER
jgi:hypothetical protein